MLNIHLDNFVWYIFSWWLIFLFQFKIILGKHQYNLRGSYRNSLNKSENEGFNNKRIQSKYLGSATICTFDTLSTFLLNTFPSFCDNFSLAKAEDEVDTPAVRSLECSTLTVRTARACQFWP